MSFLFFFLSFRHVHKIWCTQVAFCVESCVVLDLHCPPPLALFFCPIVLGIVIVCNAEGRPEEQVGHDCPCCLKNSPGQPHHEEQIKVIIVPPPLPPMVPSAATRAKKKRKNAAAPAAPAAPSNNPSTATPTPSTTPATKKGK